MTPEEKLTNIRKLTNYSSREEISFHVLRAYIKWVMGEEIDADESSDLQKAQYFLEYGEEQP